MVFLFTHNVKNTKGVAHKDSDIDGICKRGLQAGPSVPTQLADSLYLYH